MLLYEELLRLAAMPPTPNRLGQWTKPIRQYKKATHLHGRQWKKHYKAARRAAKAALTETTSGELGPPMNPP